jgi:8-amino-7-oxononanoate synthase
MEEELAERRRRGLYRERRAVQSAPGVRLRLHGREYVNFASNDYLNLAADPRLARAAARTARRYGTGAAASPLVTGYLPPHRALEGALAEWEGAEAALVLASGFTANLAAVSALAGRDDAVFSDELNHASLIDGCRLSRARLHVYRHRDTEHLDGLLGREGPRARRRLIVTDTLFSMDGDTAPLAELLDVAARHDCLLLIDEAHATGVLGECGRGLTDLLPSAAAAHGSRLIKVGTLSKALGAQGGFVCGSRTLIEWLVNHARPYIFSTTLAPPAAAAARRAVAVVRGEPERRHRLLTRAAEVREQLRAAGYATGAASHQIVPVIVGEARSALDLSARLQERGLLVPAIRPPSVPEGTSRLRISLTTGHDEEDVARLVAALGVGRPPC